MAKQATIEMKMADAKTIFALRLGFDTIASISLRVGVSKPQIKRALDRLEKQNRAYFDYGTRGWKLEA